MATPTKQDEGPREAQVSTHSERNGAIPAYFRMMAAIEARPGAVVAALDRRQ